MQLLLPIISLQRAHFRTLPFNNTQDKAKPQPRINHPQERVLVRKPVVLQLGAEAWRLFAGLTVRGVSQSSCRPPADPRSWHNSPNLDLSGSQII